MDKSPQYNPSSSLQQKLQDMERSNSKRLKQQEENHQCEMNSLLSTFQKKFEESNASVKRRILHSQNTIHTLLNESQKAIFAQMGDMIKTIQAIVDQIKK